MFEFEVWEAEIGSQASCHAVKSRVPSSGESALPLTRRTEGARANGCGGAETRAQPGPRLRANLTSTSKATPWDTLHDERAPDCTCSSLYGGEWRRSWRRACCDRLEPVTRCARRNRERERSGHLRAGSSSGQKPCGGSTSVRKTERARRRIDRSERARQRRSTVRNRTRANGDGPMAPTPLDDA